MLTKDMIIKSVCNASEAPSDAEEYIYDQCEDDLYGAIYETEHDIPARVEASEYLYLWQSFSLCVSRYMKIQKGPSRINDILTLARNLCAVKTGSPYFYKTKFADNLDVLFKSIITSGDEPKGINKDILRTILQILANFFTIDKHYDSMWKFSKKFFDMDESSRNMLSNLFKTSFSREFDRLSCALLKDERAKRKPFSLNEFHWFLLEFIKHLEEKYPRLSISGEHKELMTVFTRHCFEFGQSTKFIEKLNINSENYAIIEACEFAERGIDKLTPQQRKNVRDLIFIGLQTSIKISEEHFKTYEHEPYPDLSLEADYMQNALQLLSIVCEKGTVEFMRGLVDDGIVNKIVELLTNAEKKLPKKSKLANLATGEPDFKAFEFPKVKVSLIGAIAFLCQYDKRVQDQIRELHGLEVVLSNCIIDANNPYIKEWSILCIKILLAGNKENQEFVSKLEAKEVVTEKELENADYETTIEGGKLRLSRKNNENVNENN